ncbi:hypothetical protein KC929_02435 [Patescibacteria group bacterium]|nr:hypothetical protein [Patescibacteria group bacterium]
MKKKRSPSAERFLQNCKKRAFKKFIEILRDNPQVKIYDVASWKMIQKAKESIQKHQN